MACVQEKDTGQWLTKKLTADSTWDAQSISAFLNQKQLENVVQCFEKLSTILKLKVMLSLLYVPARNLVEGQAHVDSLIALGRGDEDAWVRLVADIMQPLSVHGTLNCINLSSTQPAHAAMIKQIKDALKETKHSELFPREASYLNTTALSAVAGSRQPVADHFALRRSSKAGSSKHDILQKAQDVLRKNANSSHRRENLVAPQLGKFRNSTDAVPLRTPTIPMAPSGVSRSTPSSGRSQLPSNYTSKSKPARTTQLLDIAMPMSRKRGRDKADTEADESKSKKEKPDPSLPKAGRRKSSTKDAGKKKDTAGAPTATTPTTPSAAPTPTEGAGAPSLSSPNGLSSVNPMPDYAKGLTQASDAVSSEPPLTSPPPGSATPPITQLNVDVTSPVKISMAPSYRPSLSQDNDAEEEEEHEEGEAEEVFHTNNVKKQPSSTAPLHASPAAAANLTKTPRKSLGSSRTVPFSRTPATPPVAKKSESLASLRSPAKTPSSTVPAAITATTAQLSSPVVPVLPPLSSTADAATLANLSQATRLPQTDILRAIQDQKDRHDQSPMASSFITQALLKKSQKSPQKDNSAATATVSHLQQLRQQQQLQSQLEKQQLEQKPQQQQTPPPLRQTPKQQPQQQQLPQQQQQQ
eukprot:scpid62159/ scgid1454/ Negative elongation factor A; Wolf-Hirschhorn syndrome candidate 2 homolog